jgi:dynein heavy chain
MENLFYDNKRSPPISKNMPPRAGEIAWARSIMFRIKAPIKKFKNKSDQLMSPTFSKVAYKYVKLAKELHQGYEQEIFNAWVNKNTDEAITKLNKSILLKD